MAEKKVLPEGVFLFVKGVIKAAEGALGFFILSPSFSQYPSRNTIKEKLHLRDIAPISKIVNDIVE